MDENKICGSKSLLEQQLEDFRRECEEKKRCEEKYKETLKYTNQMLEECKAKNYQKNKPGIAKRIANDIDEMISQNNSEANKCLSDYSVKKINFNRANKRTSNFTNPFDSVDLCDYNRNNRFLITVESGLFSAEPVNISSCSHDDKYRLKINMIEGDDQCLPMLLDTSIENGVTYKVTKTILKSDGKISYSVIYTGCKIIDYLESALDYNDTDLRTFTIIMDYKDYTYDA